MRGQYTSAKEPAAARRSADQLPRSNRLRLVAASRTLVIPSRDSVIRCKAFISGDSRSCSSFNMRTATRQQLMARTKNTDRKTEGSGLKRATKSPTRDTQGEPKAIKKSRGEVSVPTPAPRVERPITKTRRILEMRPSSLVAEVQKSHGKRSSQVVDELTAKYDLRPTETRAKINEVRVARQARRAFATEIRRHLRLDAGEVERRQFLT